MRVAVAVFNDRISPVFDVSRQIRILDVEKGRIIKEEVTMYSDDNSLHKVARLRDMKVDTLICGAISQPLERMLNESGIKILGFIAGSIEDVLKAYLLDDLARPTMAMPGCRWRYRKLCCQAGQSEAVINQDGLKNRTQSKRRN
jgi:predicted Fe-Mo cluster-binding NifX family protein